MAENNVKRLLELDKDSGKLEFDESGYVLFIPSDEEKKKIESYLKTEIDKSIEDHAPLFADIAENIKTYKASKTRYYDGDEEILPVPLASIAADQIISYTYNTINRPRPIFSFDPYFNNSTTVMVPLEVEAAMPDAMGMPMMGPDGAPMTQTTTVAVPVKVSAEDSARRLETGYEYKNRERLRFPELSQNIISSVVIAGLCYAKVCADRAYKYVMRPKVDGATIDLEDKQVFRVKKGEAVKWYTLPYNAVLKPIDEDDLDTSPWVAEKTPCSPEAFTSRVLRKEYPLIKKEEAEDLSKIVGEVIDQTEQGVRAETQKRAPSVPKTAVNLMEVQFDWDVKVKDPETGETTIERLPFCAEYHHGAGRVCVIHRNPYDHQERYIVPFWQIKDPNSFSGSCTVGRLRWSQRAVTAAGQAEFKNAFHANNFCYWWVPGSPAEEYFEKGNRLRAGEGIPGGKFDEDWGVVRAGADHFSMLPLMQWGEGLSQRISNVSAYEQGDAVPGRTPAATVAQILQQGMQQPLMFLRTLNDSFVKLMRLRILTERQYQPLGETIPVFDPKDKAIIEAPFRYPMVDENGVDPLDNLRISLTAADEALAKEKEFEQLVLRQDQFIRFANFVASVAGPMSDIRATPATIDLFRQILEGGSALNKEIVALSRSDEETFDLMPKVDALIKEREAAIAQQQLAAQNGMMNANPNAQGGGSVPGGPAGAAGSAGMAQQPDNGVPVGPPPNEGLPMAEGPIQ